MILRDGSTLRLRAPAQDDAGALTAFFSGLSERSFYQRFHGLRTIDDELVGHFLDPDWGDRGVLVGTLAGADGNDRIVAIGEYDRLRDPVAAEARSRLRTRSRVAGSARACSSGSQRSPPTRASSASSQRSCRTTGRCSGVFAGAGLEVTRELDGGEFEVRFPIASTEPYRTRVDERDHLAVTASLRPFFEPRSVAVIGASRRRGSIGGELFRNILAADFAGAAYPVNLGGEPVAGVRAYAIDRRVPEVVDLAVDLPARPAGARGRRGDAREWSQGALRHLFRLRRGRRRRPRAPGAPARPGARPRGTPRRAQLPRYRRSAPRPQRDLRSAAAAAWPDRVLLPERRPRARAAGEGLRAGSRLLGLRVDREQGRRLLERPARVVGGRRRDGARPLVPRVLRQPGQVLTARPADRTAQAGARAQGRLDRGRSARGELAHRALWRAPTPPWRRSSASRASFAPTRSRSWSTRPPSSRASHCLAAAAWAW